jgi:hypothetical protein
MLISIKRVYLESGIEAEVIINTNYVYKISKNMDLSKPKTRIIMKGFGQEPDILYTDESLATIKSKLIKSRNKKQEEE